VRSIGVTQIHTISLEKYKKLIEDFPEFKEAAGFLKDSAGLYDNY
jgi:hypothetical protein